MSASQRGDPAAWLQRVILGAVELYDHERTFLDRRGRLAFVRLVGPHWNRLTDAQRKPYMDRFHAILRESYLV